MRQIVYDNIMELIKENCSVTEKTKTGVKHTLYGTRGNVILSLYQNNRKIELFMNGKLFASESLKKPIMPFDQTYVQRCQLHKIKHALEGAPSIYQFAPNFSAKSRARRGATPGQVEALQVAWFKSHAINYEMCGKVGNSR